MSAPRTRTRRDPNLFLALLPILAMVLLLAIGYIGFDLPAEPIIVAAAVIAGVVALALGRSYDEILSGISEKLAKVLPAFLILITVGLLIGTWMISGTIPMIIYFGLELISPQWLALTALVVTAIIAVCTGTSWGAAGTVGVAFMGVAVGLDASLPVVAGAVVAGAYFGDKMSPLSDTTNLASLSTGVPLYTHIGHMVYTTGPAFLLSAVVFLFVGFGTDGADAGRPQSVAKINSALDGLFDWNPALLIPLVVVLIGSIMRKPTIPVMLLASAVAMVEAIAFQGASLADVLTASVSGFDLTMLSADPGAVPESVSTLLNRGGMASMMGTLLIAFCALAFAGVVSVTGSLDVIIARLLRLVRSTGSLILATIATCLVTIATTCNGQVSIVMPGEMLRRAYVERGLDPRNLSRTIEDSVTVTEVLIPWTAAGAFMASTLGVATVEYAPWAVLNWSGMLFAVLWGFTGFGIKRLSPERRAELLAAEVGPSGGDRGK